MALTDGIPTHGAQVQIGPLLSASPDGSGSYTPIAWIGDIDSVESEWEEEDVTNHSSERVSDGAPTIRNFADTSIVLIFDPNEPTHFGPSSMAALHESGLTYWWKLIRSDGSVKRHQAAYVKKYTENMPVKGVHKPVMTLRWRAAPLAEN